MAWAEQVCNTRQHAETGQTPMDRFTSQGPLQPVEPSLLREAFRWSVLRRVTSTASVSLAGNRYAVDASLIGRRIELRFDPEDLTRLDVFWEGRARVVKTDAGRAIAKLRCAGRHIERSPESHSHSSGPQGLRGRRGLLPHQKRSPLLLAPAQQTSHMCKRVLVPRAGPV